MIDFILDDRTVRASAPPGGVVLDFLRKSQRIVGVKEGCREGVCGACLVLVGEWEGDAISYRSMNSCLLPLGEIEGKHVVTIKGLNNRNDEGSSPIQRAILDEGATQCGYCTPGIILALTGLFLGEPHFDEDKGDCRHQWQYLPLHRLSVHKARGDASLRCISGFGCRNRKSTDTSVGRGRNPTALLFGNPRSAAGTVRPRRVVYGNPAPKAWLSAGAPLCGCKKTPSGVIPIWSIYPGARN